MGERAERFRIRVRSVKEVTEGGKIGLRLVWIKGFRSVEIVVNGRTEE